MPVQRSRQPRRLRAGDDMISVGLDIPRLGTDAGARPAEDARRVHPGDQPRRAVGRPSGAGRDAAEHVQAARPIALRAVPSLLRTFYRSVEPASGTPFSDRALDCGFAGALVALARHLDPALTPPPICSTRGGCSTTTAGTAWNCSTSATSFGSRSRCCTRCPRNGSSPRPCGSARGAAPVPISPIRRRLTADSSPSLVPSLPWFCPPARNTLKL